MKRILFASLVWIYIGIISACNNAGRHEGENTMGMTDTGSTLGGGSSSGTTSSTEPGNNANNNMGNSSTATDTTGSLRNNKVNQNDADFVSKAMRSGMMEIEAGNMAAQKAQSQRVKNFANMMVSDHTKANDELKSISTSKNITVATTGMSPEHQRDIDKLKNKTGRDFDKAYMDMMVSDHRKNVDEFKKASNNLRDPEVKNFATKTLPVLQKHSDSARAISANL